MVKYTLELNEQELTRLRLAVMNQRNWCLEKAKVVSDFLSQEWLNHAKDLDKLLNEMSPK